MRIARIMIAALVVLSVLAFVALNIWFAALWGISPAALGPLYVLALVICVIALLFAFSGRRDAADP